MNIVQEYTSGRRNFNEANLRWADLSGADLRWANLSGANLHRANLHRANLRGANLSGANLRRADLRWANLSGADLRWANLSGANLSGADLSEADLSGANLSGADLRWANLSGADLSHTRLPAPTAVLSANWGQVPEDLCLDLMRYDASNHPAGVAAFDRWALDGPCPYAVVETQRCANFQESRSIWQNRPTTDAPVPTALELVRRLLAASCRGSTL